MKRTNKKGFTIVELVIVIAVIAILAAVLIPNISRLVKKAQISSDLSLVRNLNMALETESATMDYPTAYSAFQAVKENGYDIAKIEAKASNNQILYDEVNKCFAYMNGKNLEYYPNSTKSDKTTPEHQLWAVYTDSTKAQESKYSVYWNGATAFNGTVKAGFDAGDTTGNVVTYSNTAVQSVVIRTNGGKLTVNAAGSHVEHYGMATQITVTAVSDSTYVEHGTVAKMTVAKDAKRVIIKSTAVVVELEGNASTLVENNGYIGSAKEGTKVSGITVGGNTIKVSTFDQLQGLALASTIGADVNGKTIELQNDIDASGRTWIPFGWNKDHAFTGTIDGKGRKITGLSADGYSNVSQYTNELGTEGTPYALIAYAKWDVTVKDLTLDVNFVQKDSQKLFTAGVLSSYDFRKIEEKHPEGYKVLISNCTVNGTISGSDNVGGIMGANYIKHCDGARFASVDFTIENCVNNATLKSENRVGGIVGKVSTNNDGLLCTTETLKAEGATREAISFEIVNCKNTAQSTIETTSNNQGVGGIIGYLTSNDKNTLTKISNCSNEATLKASENKAGTLLYAGAENKVMLDGKVKECPKDTAVNFE